MKEIKSYDEALNKAKEEFEYLVSDPQFQEEYRDRIDYLRDQISYYSYYQEEGMKKGLEKGMKKGIKEGIKEGINKNKEETAKRMLEKNMEIEDIIDITGLTRKEIEKIKEKIDQ